MYYVQFFLWVLHRFGDFRLHAILGIRADRPEGRAVSEGSKYRGSGCAEFGTGRSVGFGVEYVKQDQFQANTSPICDRSQDGVSVRVRFEAICSL